jgi:NADH dehydrogenase
MVTTPSQVSADRVEAPGVALDESGPPDPRPHVVIIGGGFAGLNAAKTLRRSPVRVTLIDKRNFHLFQPLLYQVATASLAPSDIAYPLRSILRDQHNVTVLMGEVTAIDLEHQHVTLGGNQLPWDYLVVATGMQSSYFGHDEWERHAPTLKSIEDALAIRRRVLGAFERAEQERDQRRRAALLTFVVVGGGPTGVELAGALAEISHQTLKDEFRTFDPAQARIVLVEGGDTLLSGYPQRLTTAARRSLEKLGVEVQTNRRVTAITDGVVQIGSDAIHAETVLWSAGVEGEALGAQLSTQLGVDLVAHRQVPVTAQLTLEGHPNVYVVGDLAVAKDAHGEPLPGVAQVAMQGGVCAAKNIQRAIAGKPPKPFHYRDKGMIATIGWNRAVAKIGPLELSGFLAWAIWALIHIAFLINFRSRFSVMLQWTWAYISRDRGSRLISGDQAPNTAPAPETAAGSAGD